MKKKILILSAILIIAICILFFNISAYAVVYTGNCGANGSNVTYNLDTETGILEITGTGDMANYSSSSRGPWYSNRNSVKTVKISDGVTSIGSYAFYHCSSLTSVTIPDSVTSIGSQAFSVCSSLTSVTIPDSVTSIGSQAFYWCSILKAIEVDENNSYYCDIDGVLFTKDKKTLVAYPAGGSTTYTIPDSVTSIGSRAFYWCSSLTSVTIPDSVTSIGSLAFYWCSSLTSVTIPDSVTSIGDGAFLRCSSLTSVTIPDSVTSIGSRAFYWCSSLTSVTIPDSVTSIGSLAFYWCSSLTSVTIPDSVTSIGDGAFSRCSSLTSVTIGDSVTSIGYEVFYDCSSLTSATFKTKNATIDSTAFNYCSKLETIYLYLNSTADSYFSDTEYTKIYLDDESDTPKGDYEYTVNDDGTSVTITKYIGSGGDVVIPQKLDGYDVTIIGDTSFSKCETLTGVTIPEGVTSIGYSAFEYCSNLASVTFPETLTIISDFAFYYCDALVKVTIPESVTKIGSYAFRSCGSLTSITFLTKNATIGSSAFDYCDKLETIYLYRNSTADSYFPDEGYTKIYLDAVHTCSPEGAWIYSADSHWKLCSCGNAVDKANHTAGTVWLSDADNHWRECTVCGYEMNKAGHTEGADGYCTICLRYVHVHSAQGDWQKDSTYHWKLCSCGIKVLEGAHVDANSDEICDDCGHTISISGGIIEIGSATTVRGNTVSVDITLSENPGISGLLLKFDFNRDALKLKEIVYKNWNVQGEDNLGEASSDEHISILFYNEDDITYNGQIATLIFEVIEDAPIGEHTIDLYYIEAVNKDQINVIMTATDGKITVRQSIAGDVNFDGRVSIKDNVLLAQYLAGWGVTVDTNAADCNGDGVISVKDIVLLSQYLSDWDVALVTIN